MYCKYCGALMDDNSKFCHKCGSSQIDNKPKQEKTNWKMIFIICSMVCLVVICVFVGVLFGKFIKNTTPNFNGSESTEASETEMPKVKIKEVVYETRVQKYQYDEKGCLLSHTTIIEADEIEHVVNVEWKVNGNFAEGYVDDELVYEHEFDEVGRLISYKNYQSGHCYYESWKYEGEKIVEYISGVDMADSRSSESVIKYKYDAKNRRIEAEVHVIDVGFYDVEEFDRSIIYEYNKNDELITEYLYEDSGALVYCLEYEYDDGLLVEERKYDYSAVEQLEYTCYYEYNGNHVKVGEKWDYADETIAHDYEVRYTYYE